MATISRRSNDSPQLTPTDGVIMRRALLLLALIASAKPAFAGNNATGQAWLSWDQFETVIDRPAAPSGTFPLFLHIAAAPDIQVLAVDLRWFPFDSVGQCYRVVPATPDTACGWTTFDVPPEGFEGDSTYTWRIVFPPLSLARSCVTYSISAIGCATSAPADFVLASVKVKDSAGAVDSLAVRNGATILGGSEMAVIIASAEPREVSPGLPASLTITGANLDPRASLDLEQSDVRIPATFVAAPDTRRLVADLYVPNIPGKSLDVIVRLPDGRQGRLADGVTVGELPAGALAATTWYRPTNDSAAFRVFDIYADRTAAVGSYDHFTGSVYPSYLHNDNLLVTRSPTDTVALFNSDANDGTILYVFPGHPESWVEYTLSQPRRMTSVGLLTMGRDLYNGSGDFADLGKPWASVLATFADGDTAGVRLRAGTHLRNWGTGTACGGQPLFTGVPTDTLTAVIYSGAEGRYYDAQEVRLPTEKWSKKLSKLRVSCIQNVHACTFGPEYTGVRYHGLAAWPEFGVTNGSGQGVVREPQETGTAHGGYLYGGVAVGTRRLTDETACQVASMAMNFAFYGVPCTVTQLNAYLRSHQGYQPDPVAVVTRVSVTGDTIEFSGPAKSDGVNWKDGDQFLVERGNYVNPLATFQLLPGPRGRAVLVPPRHDPGTPVVAGDRGWVYWNMVPGSADDFTGGQLRSRELPGSAALPAIVESLLTSGIPVQLNTHGHFVVADGWVPSFWPGPSARGTYAIKDPFTPRNYTRLIRGKYLNEFKLGRYVVPPAAQQSMAADDRRGLGLVVSHTTNVTVTDPMGRQIRRNPGTGLYESTIPDAWVIDDVAGNHDIDGELDAAPINYQIFIPSAVDGEYVVQATTDGGMGVSVAACDSNGVIAVTAAIDTSTSPVIVTYDVTYSSGTGSVGIEERGTTAVHQPPGRSRSTLQVRRNPSIGPVEFLVTSAGKEAETIDVYDLTGRQVGTISAGVSSGGVTTARWDWSRTGYGSGVYLARLRSTGRAVRFVALR